MVEVTLREAVCKLHGIKESNYSAFVLKRTLFRRARLVRPLVTFFYPDFLFNERRLVDRVGNSASLREVQDEIDFYQHKFVVSFIMKDAFRFRISGMRLMSLANKAFRQAAASDKASGDSV
jgi:hypothetical protein